MMCQVRLHWKHNRLEKLVERLASTTTGRETTFWAGGDSVASEPGNLQMVKKVVVAIVKYNDYMDEIRQSYELGFTPFRLHTNTQHCIAIFFVKAL